MPEWHEIVTFKGFKPRANQMATITVFDHGALFNDKIIGTAEFELPTNFATLKRHDLELKSPTTGHLHGVILLRSVIVENSRMTPDDFEMNSNGKIPVHSMRGNVPKMKGQRSTSRNHYGHSHHHNHDGHSHHQNSHRSDHQNGYGNHQPVPMSNANSTSTSHSQIISVSNSQSNNNMTPILEHNHSPYAIH